MFRPEPDLLQHYSCHHFRAHNVSWDLGHQPLDTGENYFLSARREDLCPHFFRMALCLPVSKDSVPSRTRRKHLKFSVSEIGIHSKTPWRAVKCQGHSRLRRWSLAGVRNTAYVIWRHGTGQDPGWLLPVASDSRLCCCIWSADKLR